MNGILVASIYLPNGNPQPGPKFNYKLAWFERLIAHAADLRAVYRLYWPAITTLSRRLRTSMKHDP